MDLKTQIDPQESDSGRPEYPMVTRQKNLQRNFRTNPQVDIIDICIVFQPTTMHNTDYFQQLMELSPK
jgi:hypothetical protein